jgi:hypothetical protein
MAVSRALPLRRTTHRGFMRLELPVNDGAAITVDRDFRCWLDLGYVLEIADATECSFAEFRAQCSAAIWEYAHCFYRNARYRGRHGELQIVDTIEPDGVKVLAIDGRTEEPSLFSATGLPPATTALFADGHRVTQRRTFYDPAFVGSPFYGHRQHVIVTDATMD